MKKIQLLIISACILVGISTVTYAQTPPQQANVEFSAKNFKERKDAFKEAYKNLKTGDKYYEFGEPFYSLALPYYLKAYAFNPNNAMLNFKIANCYLRSIEKEKSIRHYKKAESLNYKVHPDLHFKLGEAYHLNYKFDEAIEHFNKYRNNLLQDELKNKVKIINKKIQECQTAKQLIADSVRVFIDNIGTNINSRFHDYAPLITTDESMMIFTSKREGSVGNKLDKNNEYDEDIYISMKQSGVWQPALNAGRMLNTKINDATIGLSPDGQQLFIYTSENGGDILYSKKDGNEWTKPEAMHKSINSKWHESSASFSFDNQTIFFSTNNPEILNFGEHDIFMSKIKKKDKWEKPVNIGSVVNTEYDEVDVFMHPDGRTMFFASNGHNTMGGYDIFKTTLKDDGTWTTPQNLGYPINTPADDRFFVLSGSGRRGYYSSAKIGGVGGHDIYMITFLGPEKKLLLSTEDNLIASLVNPVKEKPVIEEVVEIRTTRLTIVKGTVIDGFAEQLTPLEADIEISDTQNGQIISQFKSNAATGKFLLPLPSGKNYGIAVKKEGYLFHSENFNIPATTNYQEIYLDIKLLKMQKEAKIVLRNVFFEFGKATLDPASFYELDRLIQILTDYPKIRIEIGGHTDNKGTPQFNQELSEKRAKSVVDYLARKIPTERLEYKGYGLTQPVAPNDTEEGRALNRRVEFKVLSTE
ncbi:MAG: OmpA family protein [Bacteroidales bacterium]